MSSEMELLKEIITELKSMRTDIQGIQKEQVETNARLSNLEAASVELRTNDKSIMNILGQLQGDIEEIQADTQYLAMRKLIDKKRDHDGKILQRFTPADNRE